MSSAPGISCTEAVLEARRKYEETEPDIGAWRTVCVSNALEDAAKIDQTSEEQEITAELCLKGIPFGVKDVIDTADVVTEYGSSFYSGHVPSQDATCVAQFKRSGAVLFGKTTTTEFATRTPTSTKNPLDLTRTPGGSSSGSAAAVASGVVPLAFGTQTVGSTIRPAAYCGVHALKPTKDLISTTGLHALSPFFDVIGLFGADLDYLSRGLDALVGREIKRCSTDYTKYRLGVCTTAYWPHLSAAAQKSFNISIEKLRVLFKDVKTIAPDWTRNTELEKAMWALISYEAQREMVSNYGSLEGSVSTRFSELLRRGERVSRNDAKPLYKYFKSIEKDAEALFDTVDLIVSPSSLGTAPKGFSDTGSPSLNAVWQVSGLPIINVPSAILKDGMPVGIQVVGPAYEEERLIEAGKLIETALKTG